MNYHTMSYKNYHDAWYGLNGMTFSLANKFDEELRKKHVSQFEKDKKEKKFRDSIIKIEKNSDLLWKTIYKLIASVKNPTL